MSRFEETTPVCSLRLFIFTFQLRLRSFLLKEILICLACCFRNYQKYLQVLNHPPFFPFSQKNRAPHRPPIAIHLSQSKWPLSLRTDAPRSWIPIDSKLGPIPCYRWLLLEHYMIWLFLGYRYGHVCQMYMYIYIGIHGWTIPTHRTELSENLGGVPYWSRAYNELQEGFIVCT